MAMILIFLLCLPVVALGANWYATPTASDANLCTAGAPCKSFQKLIERPLTAGDFLHLECGKTYRETAQEITPLTSGTSSAKITLQPYGTCVEQRGVHTGAEGAAVLTDTTTNFSTLDVTPTTATNSTVVFNLTKGAHCNVSAVSATTLTCAQPLSHTLPVTWSPGDRYVVENKPIVTHALLLNTAGNWTCSGGVCRHTVTATPHRHVWIDGQSTHAMMHDGTCSATMPGATDGQYCSTSNTVYIKTTENPATRWTRPGVEAAPGPYAKILYRQAPRQWWIIKNIAFEKVYGQLLSVNISNITFDGIRAGHPQRKNCLATQSCWEGRVYPWQHDGNDRDSSMLKVSAFGATNDTWTNIVIKNSLFHDGENNQVTFSGLGSIEATIQHSEFINNSHSTWNTGLSSSAAGKRILTLENNTVHGCTACWHSGAQGANHQVLFRNNFFYDVLQFGDPRPILKWEPTSAWFPYGIYLQEPGTYTHSNNIIIGGGSGFRITNGTHLFTENVIYANTKAGINANGNARIRFNNNIIADNGTGAADSTSFQVGCSSAPCNNSLFQPTTGQSNNNKFRQASGTTFAYMSGQTPATKSLTQWQSITGGDTTSVTTDDCFVSVANEDFNLTPTCDDVGPKRGPFRELTFSSAAMVGASLDAVWTIGGVQPISKCTSALATVTYGGVGQTEGACVGTQALANQTKLAMGAAPTAGATVQLTGGYGMAEDFTCIGGRTGACLNAKSRAFGPVTIGSTGGVIETGWVQGSERSIPSGSNRLLVAALCWEKQPVSTSPISVTACSYGGQAMTLAHSATHVDATDPFNISNAHAAFWILKEAQITAATNTSLLCTRSEAENGGRPFILASGVYEGINQTDPVLPGAVSATIQAGTSLSTAPLTPTGNPGVPVQLGCSPNDGAFAPGTGWTEQLDIPEDTSPGTRMHVGDRTSAGQTTIAGSVTFTKVGTNPERLALLAMALNGGASLPPDPGGATVRTQTGSRCAFHNAPGWQGPQDAPCMIVPGHQLAVVGEYAVSGATEPVPVGKQLNCCWSNCELSESFFPVDNAGTNGVRYAPSGLFPHGMVIDDRLLTGSACDHVPGAFITQDSMVPQALAVGQCSTMGYILEVMSSVNPLTQPTLTCAMALDDGTPFASGARTTIQVRNGAAGEGGGPGQGTAVPPVEPTFTHYVAPAAVGTGDHTTVDNAGLASTVWSKLLPGATVDFLEGTYTGATSMLTPTPGVSGTKDAYITLKAQEAGTVFIDGENARQPLVLNNNKYVIVEGFDVGNSNGHTCLVQNMLCTESGGCAAAPTAILRQLVCFDALAAGDGKILQNNNTEYVVWEDIAAWGTGRKVAEAYESDFTTWRRIFAVWGGGGSATATAQMAVSMTTQSYHNTLENAIVRWNRGAEIARDARAIIGFEPLETGHPYFATYGLAAHAKVLGSATLVRSGDTYDVSAARASVWTAGQTALTDITMQDVVFVTQPGVYDDRKPLLLEAHTGATPANKVANRVSTAGTTLSSIGTGWVNTHRLGPTTVAGLDIWDGTDQATLCKRYVNGVLTTTALWPWRMEDRINAAAGRPSSSIPVSDLLDGASTVTTMMEGIFGGIPEACGGTVIPNPPAGPALYVAHNGMGTACTSAAPCALTTGISQAQPGDEVVLKNGTYTAGVVQTVRNGTAGNPITIRAENRRMAKLSHQFTIKHSYITVRGLDIESSLTTGGGIYAAGAGPTSRISNFIVEDNFIHRSRGNAFTIHSAFNGIVRHNLIQDVGMTGDVHGEGMYISSSTAGSSPVNNIEIYGNTYRRYAGNCLDIKQDATFIHAHHNICEDNCLTLATGRTEGACNGVGGGAGDGMIRSEGSHAVSGNLFEDNIVRNGPGNWVLYFQSNRVDVENNVFYNLTAPYYLRTAPDGNRIVNNVWCNTSDTKDGPLSGQVVTGNTFNAPQSACDAEVTRILAEMATLPGL